MNQTKKYLLFGCMAAVLVTADSFPAFAGDSELYGVSLDQEEQAKAPVALDITAVYGKTEFCPVKDPPLRPVGECVSGDSYRVDAGERKQRDGGTV